MERNGKSLGELPIMSIENPTLSAAADLAHFRHFIRRGGFSSHFTNLPSTSVESALQISPFYAKQTQSQVCQNQPKLLYDKYICKNGHLVIRKNKAKTNPIKAKTNPIQTQFNERPKLMQSVYLQMIMKKYANMGQKNKAKTNPISNPPFSC